MQIHPIVAPATVNLPLGEQNKSELLMYEGYAGSASEPYLVKLDMTIDTLPADAWCKKSTWSDTGLGLSCVWATPNAATAFTTADILISLPSKDVWVWDLNRETLQAVPQMRGWFWVNGWNMFLVGVFALFGVLCAWAALIVKKEESLGGSILVD